MFLLLVERNMLSNDSDLRKMLCFKPLSSPILFREVTAMYYPCSFIDFFIMSSSSEDDSPMNVMAIDVDC